MQREQHRQWASGGGVCEEGPWPRVAEPSVGTSLERLTGAVSLPIWCRVKDKGVRKQTLEWVGPTTGRKTTCDNNPGGGEEGVNWAEVVRPKRQSGLEKLSKICRTRGPVRCGP